MRKASRTLAGGFLLCIIIAGVWLMFALRQNIPADEEKIRGAVQATASFYPLYYIVERIGGADVNATSVVSAGVEPHEYEPTPRDIARVLDTDVFVYHGGGIDPWALQVVREVQTRGAETVDAHAVAAENVAEGGGAAAKSKGPIADPHFWLDPVAMIRVAEVVRDALARADAPHAVAYMERAEALIADLQALDRAYAEGLAQCAVREIITAHDAFGHMAARYRFAALSIAGLSPEAEPTARQLAALVTLARERTIRYVLFETLTSPRIAETLAREVGAEIMVLNPLEGLTPDDTAAGADYLTIMYSNLKILRTAMSCA